MHACRHIRAYPIYEREAIFHNYIPLQKLPRLLEEVSSSKSGKRVARPVEHWNSSTLVGTPLGVFSTPTESSKSAAGSPRIGSSKKSIIQLLTKNLFPITADSAEMSGTGIRPSNSKGSIEEVEIFSEPIGDLDPILPYIELDTMAGAAAAGAVPIPPAVPGAPPVLGAPAPRPAVPIAVQMGAAGDRTTNVAPLPTFSGWPGADPDQHLSQFLTVCVANNRRTEDIWLKWLPATLKDTAFEWYNRQPAGSFPTWNALKDAFLLHFRPVGYADRLREQLMRSHMIPGESVDSYYGRVADILRRWPNNNLPDQFVLSILINGLYPSELKMFVKESQPATVALSLARARVWEECHYDQLLNLGVTMIPVREVNPSNWNKAIHRYSRPISNSVEVNSGVFNPVPLQTLPPPMAVTYPQSNPYQNQVSNSQEMVTVSVPKDSNEMLLLNLTKKMEELAVNMAKDKEKRPKQTNFRANIWCTNCKGQGHLSPDCPSPPNMKIQCKHCGLNHSSRNCWHVNRPPHFNNPTMYRLCHGM